MDKIKVKLTKAGEDIETVGIEDIVSLLQSNRDRIRNLNNMVLTICGLLLSASFVVIFFAIQSTNFNVSILVPILFFGSVGGQILSMLYSIFASIMPRPSAVRTKFELIDTLTSIYHREYRRSIVSVIFLVLAIIAFAAGLIVFAVTSLQ